MGCRRMTENEFLREVCERQVAQNIELVKQLAAANAQIETLTEQVAVLTERVNELLEQLDKKKKNSNNSSRPPSSDGYSKPAPKSLKQSSGKKPGGQKGHKGSSMKLLREPDEIREHYPSACVSCPNRALCQMRIAERRYEQDMIIRTHIIEHRQMACCCPKCGNDAVIGAFPAHITATKQYGHNIISFASALSTVGMVSIDRIQKLLSSVFQISISTGTIQNGLRRLYEQVKTPVKYIRNKVSQLPLLHCDETGLRVDKKLRWLHCMCDSEWSYYMVHDKRGTEAMEAIGLLPEYRGILLHDFWKSYFVYDQAEHAMCCAHLLRELVYAEEVKHQDWAKPLRELLVEILAERKRLSEAGNNCFSSTQMEEFYSRYDALIAKGLEENPLSTREKGKMGAPKKGEIRSLLERFRDYKPQILRFAVDWSIPFTNNEAERSIRFSKVKGKVSGCFRTKQGAEEYVTIMSYINTAYKHGVDFFTATKAALAGNALPLVAQWG